MKHLLVLPIITCLCATLFGCDSSSKSDSHDGIDAGADADTDADTDTDGDADADLDSDADGDSDADADGDTDVDAGQDAGCEGAAYRGCNGSDVYWFDGCDRPTSLAEDCPGVHPACVPLGKGSAECGCLHHWSGAQCDLCPGNWDSDQNCAGCKTGWVGLDCEVAGCVRYVDVDVLDGGGADGLTWPKALGTVQFGINAAAASVDPDAGVDSCEVWVAEGIYHVYQGSRTDTVALAPNVLLFGGFDGTETDRSERDWKSHLTALEGREKGWYLDAGVTGQVYHVVTGSNDAGIDGFLIAGGYADGTWPHGGGGGMLNTQTSPTVRNCIFVDNFASNFGGGMQLHVAGGTVVENCLFTGNEANDGGGMRIYSCSPAIRNTVFAGNRGYNWGGGLLIYYESPTVENAVFAGNVCDLNGGGVYNRNSQASFMNCTIAGNAAASGGGMFNLREGTTDPCEPVVTNSIAWGNTPNGITQSGGAVTHVSYSDAQSWTGGGTGNLDPAVDPDFADVPLSTGSWNSASYDPPTYQSALRVSGSPWTSDALVGTFVQPDTTIDGFWFPIVRNTANTLYVWGDVVTRLDLDGTESFAIYDIRLAGSSQCIDKGLSTGAPERDIAGQARYDLPTATDATGCDAGVDASCFDHVDMGAYEYWPN